MISGIHLATALSVMLHMEQEGNKNEDVQIMGVGRLGRSKADMETGRAYNATRTAENHKDISSAGKQQKC